MFYHANNQLTQVTDPNGQTINYTYDDMGNLTAVAVALTPPPASRPQITQAPAVANPLLQLGNQSVVEAGATNLFAVAATDPNGAPLSYSWSFGDGTTSPASSESTAKHVYGLGNCGPYTASVTVSNPTAATVSNLTVTVACQLKITKLQAAVNFAKANSDSSSLSGTVDLGMGFNPANQLVTVDIGGVRVPFSLDAKGSSRGAYGSCKLTYNKKTGMGAVTVALSKGSWQGPLAGAGLVNITTPKTGVLVTVPVSLLIGQEAFLAEKSLTYKATHNKSGTAK